MSVHSLSNTRRKEEALKLSPHPLGMIVRVSCSLHVFLPSEARRHGSDRRSCCPVQPIAWSDRRGGKSLLGGGKCDADIAMSNRELNLGLQFQNRVQTTRILQLKKKKGFVTSLCFLFPHPQIPPVWWGSVQSQEQRLGGIGVFLGTFPAALKSLGTSGWAVDGAGAAGVNLVLDGLWFAMGF